MYTEISKIIEGGLNGDKEKVFNYSKVLIKNLEDSGENILAKKINNILTSRKPSMVSLDSLTSRPVDGESRMEMVDVSLPTLELDSIVINENIEQEISDFIKCYQNRDKLLKMGLDGSNTLLLYGPPGCGKTTLAQFISMKTQLPLVTARLDGMISSLLGSTAKNIRKIFEFAARMDCILFLDEFDVIAKVRDDKNETGELKRVVNSLIQNIDMFSHNSIVIAATNHHELLDPAIWRRFTRVLTLVQPDIYEIEELLKKPLSQIENDLIDSKRKKTQVASALVGMSHSDIKTIMNNTIKEAVVNDRQSISVYNILKEIYIFKNHTIADEDKYIEYLINHEMTHRELQAEGLPLRKIQSISKQLREERV